MKNIMFCGNDKVFDGMLTCMLSIFKRSRSTEPYHFYVLTMSVPHLKEDYVAISDKKIKYLEKVAKMYNPESVVTKHDVTDLYMKYFSECPNEDAYCSPYTLIRLFADMIPDIPSKILYLDADVMFNRDIELLYNINVDKYEFAAAPDRYGKLVIRPDYINAGVLLFNMDKCKETGLFEKAREQIQKHKLIFADQSAIWWSYSKKKTLRQRFNEQAKINRHTVVFHFSKRLMWWPYIRTENIKQWNITDVHKVYHFHEFDDILYEYIFLKKVFEEPDEVEALTKE